MESNDWKWDKTQDEEYVNPNTKKKIIIKNIPYYSVGGDLCISAIDAIKETLIYEYMVDKDLDVFDFNDWSEELELKFQMTIED